MTRTAPLALVLAALAFPARAGQADFAADFAPLKTELERRRDGDLSGTLDAAQKRQRAAVLKALAAIQKGGDGLRDELVAARAAAKALRPPYPGEFQITLAPPVLGTLFGALLGTLQAEAATAVADLEAAVDILPVDESPKVAPLAEQARAALDGAADATDPARWAGALLRALAAAEKGQALVARFNARRGTLALNTGTAHLVADSVHLRYTNFDWFDIVAGTAADPAQAPPSPGAFRLLLSVRGNSGTEVYYAEVTLAPGGNGIYRAASGTVTITGGSKTTLAGNFSFTATNPAGAVRAVTGSFDARR